jgi:hypothetical protein
MGSPISEMDLTSLAWCLKAIRPVQIIHRGTRQTTSLRLTQKSISFIKLKANTIRSTYWYTLGQNREKLQPQTPENRSYTNPCLLGNYTLLTGKQLPKFWRTAVKQEQSTWWSISKDLSLHKHHCENLKSHISWTLQCSNWSINA